MSQSEPASDAAQNNPAENNPVQNNSAGNSPAENNSAESNTPGNHTAGHPGQNKVVSASQIVSAPASVIFELIADPSRHPEWDGHDNLSEAAAGQRVTAVGDVFEMTLTKGVVRENHVVEFEEDRLIAWKPSEPGQPQPGHLWLWALTPAENGATQVTHTYDWSNLTDETRFARAQSISPESLAGSIARLKTLAEAEGLS